MLSTTKYKADCAPISGVGIGVRSCHFTYINEHKPKIPWFEAQTDDYLGNQGLPLEHLEAIRNNYPIALHGVGLSIGSSNPLDLAYINQIKALQTTIEPTWISDHLCWSSHDKFQLHDLLPLPYLEEVISYLAQRIRAVQDILGCRILIENISSYLEYRQSTLTEWEFLTAVANEADCWILLDINNIYVNSHNHNFNPYDYLTGIPIDRVKQFHLAGYCDQGNYYLDSHGETIHDPVWELYRAAIKRFGQVPTLIEWDLNIPPFTTLQQQAQQAQSIYDAHEH